MTLQQGDDKAQPLHHVERNDWHDDRDLIEEVAATIDLPDSSYDHYKPGVLAFREWVNQFRKRGYDKSPEAFQLGSWLRELLAEKGRREGSYNLNTRPLFIPDDLNEVIRERKSKGEGEEETKDGEAELPAVFNEVLTTGETRTFAQKRAEALHDGNLADYLSFLVEKERNAMGKPSHGIADLLDGCRLHMARRKLKFVENYMVGETDFWIPTLSLGVEAVLNWKAEKEQRILGVIGQTKFRLQAKNFAIVASLDIPEHQYDVIRDIENRKVFDNLRVLRIDKLGEYLNEILDESK